METPIFHEQQRFTNRRLAYALFIIVLVFSVYSILSGFVRGMEILGLVIAALITYLFYRIELTVEVTPSTLRILYPPLTKRNIPIYTIRSCESRKYRPLVEYGGWGVRCGRKGRAYNVKGNLGVQLTLTNGESILIGSQKPDELLEAIRKNSPDLMQEKVL